MTPENTKLRKLPQLGGLSASAELFSLLTFSLHRNRQEEGAGRDEEKHVLLCAEWIIESCFLIV